jgi:hypothetical protein
MKFDSANHGHGHYYDLVKRVTRQEFKVQRLEAGTEPGFRRRVAEMSWDLWD